MKLKIILLSLFFFSLSVPQVSGDVPYSYTFDNPNFQIARSEYDRYIKPQLRAILSDFYQMLRYLHPIHKHFIPIKQMLNEIRTLEIDFTANCLQETSLKCKELLNKIYNKSLAMDTAILQTYESLSTYSLNASMFSPEDRQIFSQEDMIDSEIILLPTLDQISTYSFQLLAKLEKTLLFYNTTDHEMIDPEEFLSPFLRPLQIYTELLILDATPVEEREIFKSVWTNFIKKIEQNILETDNTQYLLTSLGDLNFLWNDFHVYLSKGNVPNKVSSQIMTIHNRWNSILRIILN